MSTTVAEGESNPFVAGRAARTGVTVVVPMFNEEDCADSLVASLDRVDRALGDRYDFEFLLVDDGSADGTVARLEELTGENPRFRIERHAANRGIAAAIQTGLRAAQHDVVASMDCDGSYDPLLLAEMIPRLAPGVDLVTASPYHVQGAVENVPLWRLRLSRLASRLYGRACRRQLSCYTSCFRIYRRSSVAPIEVDNEGFVGVAELLCKLLAQGGVVVEQPALLRARIAGRSKMRVIRASVGHLRLISRIAAQRFRGRCANPAGLTPPAQVNAEGRQELSYH